MTRKTPSRKAQSKQREICAKITSLIVDYLSDNLKPKTLCMFEQHMRICPDCVAFLNTYKKTVQVTGSLRYEDIPPEVAKRVQQFLRKRFRKV